MNRTPLTALYITLALTLISCATAKANPNPDEVSLSAAIREAARRMETRLEAGTKIALVNVTSPSAAFSEYVLDELSEVLVNNAHLVVVDRTSLDRARQELGFNASGEVSDESAQRIGQMLGAQALVTGSLTSFDNFHRLTLKTITTETAAVTVQHSADIANDRRVQTLLAQGGPSRPANYNSAEAAGGTGGGTAAASGNRQTTQARAPTGPKNGTYTFYPRLQAMQAGLSVAMWIPQITVSKDFIVIFFAGSATGDFSDGRSGLTYSDWRDADYVQLQDLDNPSRFYKPVSIKYSDNGGGRIWSMSFSRFSAVRFKLSCGRGSQTPMVFEEITLGEPDAN